MDETASYRRRRGWTSASLGRWVEKCQRATGTLAYARYCQEEKLKAKAVEEVLRSRKIKGVEVENEKMEKDGGELTEEVRATYTLLRVREKNAMMSVGKTATEE